MTNKSLQPYYLDASALVKLVVDEPYSDRLRAYIYTPECSWRVCTSLCFAEAMGVLKRKQKNDDISQKAYVEGARRLMSMVRENRLEVLKDYFISHSDFAYAEKIANEYSIDFIDAFQMVSCKSSWDDLASPSKPVLVTADGALTKVAEKEGVKFWYCRETHQPKC